jgi:hypothetical protein
MLNIRKISLVFLSVFCILSVDAQEVKQPSKATTPRKPRPKYEYILKEVKKDTVCINMQTINSKWDDYMPFLIGKNQLLFTSNRKNTQEGQTLEYSEKVYYTTRKGKNEWTPPRKNGYTWNSDNNTALIGVGDALYYFYRCYWLDNGEIFTALRSPKAKEPWQAANLKKLTRICTEFDENSITPANGDSVFFTSNRTGNYDIYLQVGKNKPVAIDILNTKFDENDVFFSFTNKTLYFSSNREGGIGGYDIYRSKIVDNQFTQPELIRDSLINSASNDRDFRWYNDSVMFLSSNRIMGVGGYDIYEIKVKSKSIFDSIEIKRPIIRDTIQDMKSELYAKLKELGLFPFKGEVQVGAYRYIPSLDKFQERFPCIKAQKVRMDKVVVDDTITVHKYIIDTVYTDVEKAVNKQLEIEKMHCLPEEVFSDMPFIGMLDKNGNRFAIFWKKDEFAEKNIFYIFKNGKMIWKTRLF